MIGNSRGRFRPLMTTWDWHQARGTRMERSTRFRQTTLLKSRAKKLLLKEPFINRRMLTANSSERSKELMIT